MHEVGWLTNRFEQNRARLHALAYRMLGSQSEAEDAVQEAWLRLHRIDPETIDNLEGWLTTVVSRVCLDMLRSRQSRREESIGAGPAAPVATTGGVNPEAELVLADSVGVALLVVLDTLTPAERLAFVLHDLFGMPFDEIGSIMGRSSGAAKQLASRARRRVRGSTARSEGGRARQRNVVEAFLAAVRGGDLAGLLAVLDPDAVLHIDAASRVDGVVRVDAPAAEAGQPRELKGASTWAARMIALTRGLPARFVQLAEIDGSVGVIFAPRGKLVRAMTFAFADAGITRVESVGDPVRLRELVIRVLSHTEHFFPTVRACCRSGPTRRGRAPIRAWCVSCSSGWRNVPESAPLTRSSSDEVRH